MPSKNMIPILIIICLGFLVGCQKPDQGIPEKLEDQKAYLKDKKAALKALKTEIAEIEAEIEKLDPKPVAMSTLVSVLPIELRRFTTEIELQANLEGDDLVNASSEVGGRLLDFNLKEGQSVSRGQVIGRIDMETVNKQIAEVETSLDLAQTTYERQAKLWEQNIGSEMQYLQSKNNVERLEKSLETIRFQLSKATIYSPTSGVVDRKIANSGEVIAPGQPIVQLLNLSRIKVVSDVPENYLGKVKRGQYVTVKIPALELEKKGRISLIGRSIDAANRTFKIEIDLANQNKILKPNLLASVSFIDIDKKEAIAIPTSLVQQEANGDNYVYLAKEENGQLISKKIKVEVGESSNEEILVTEGLQAGDLLVNEGARIIKEDEKIELIK